MLIEKINAWTESCPNRIAHHHRDQSLTYAQLKIASDDLAVWLHQEGDRREIKRGTPIIVYGHKESEMLICFIGCVKAGFPYIPVDSSVPPERVRQIIEASGAEIVLSPQRVPEGNHQAGILVVEDLSLDQEGHLFFSEGHLVSERTLPLAEWQVREDEVYYIIYTSGSTGIPKGVQITLGALESFLNWVNPEYSPQERTEIFLNQAPFSFDLSVMDLYMSLSTGGTLFSLDKDQIANPKELFAALAEAHLTFWVSTPSFTEVCLMDRSFNEDLLPELKRFLFCGEVLTHDCALKLNERFPKALVENMYGPTEATVATTSLTVTAEILKKFNPLPIGRAKPGTYVLVCDSETLSSQLEETGGALLSPPYPLPEGLRGELIIAGPNVSVGYLNNPAQTREAFFSWEENGQAIRAYRTGDAGTWMNGMLFYYGRLDFQVKLHGYRIELGDIEENLRKVSWIDNAVVLPIEKRGKIDYLQAFMTTNLPVEDEFSQSRLLRDALKEYIPEYMIPRRLRFIEKMPMTPNGKVDRRALLGGTK